ncbi:MAG: class I SAM-dependent methyltransferase [Actinomycetota bacterium]
MRKYKSIKKLPIIGDENEHFIWNMEVWGAFQDFPDCHVGGNSFILKKDKVSDYFPEIVKRFPNLLVTVKVNFQFQNDGFTMDKYIIKNIAWLKGFAPRVYDVIEVEDIDGSIYKSHIVEYLEGSFPHKDRSPVLWNEYTEKLKEFFIGVYGKDYYSANFINEKLIDFDEFKFDDKEKYKQDLYKRYQKTAFWGNDSKAYQHIPSIGIEGCRSYKRYELMGMSDMDLTGKTVLDIGCSGGQVLFWAKERNAERIVGVDTSEIANATFEMANFHEFFDIETVGCDLTQDNIQQLVKEETGLNQFDIVTIFSMNAHIGFHQYMRDLCKGTLFLECNAAEMEDIERIKYPKEFGKLGYTEFEYKGEVKESGTRSLFICR